MPPVVVSATVTATASGVVHGLAPFVSDLLHELVVDDAASCLAASLRAHVAAGNCPVVVLCSRDGAGGAHDGVAVGADADHVGAPGQFLIPCDDWAGQGIFPLLSRAKDDTEYQPLIYRTSSGRYELRASGHHIEMAPWRDRYDALTD